MHILLGLAVSAQPGSDGLQCLSPPYDTPKTVQQEEIASLVAWLRTRLVAYPSFTAILDNEPPELCYGEDLFGMQGYYEVETHRILLRQTLSPGLMHAVAIHELRHVHQLRRGACPHPDLSMQATGATILAMEADASAVSLAIAWELRREGEPEVWNALSNWQSHTRLANAFESEMLESGSLALAAGAAFAEWYKIDWMREGYYVAACSAYLDRQEAAHAIPQYQSIGPEFSNRLCILPDGTEYPCEVHTIKRGKVAK